MQNGYFYEVEAAYRRHRSRAEGQLRDQGRRSGLRGRILQVMPWA